MKIKGYASVFNVVDSHNETILPGAFSKTLKHIKKYKHTIPLFHEHCETSIIGKVDKLTQNKKGLLIEATLFDKKIIEDLKKFSDNGIEMGFSIGYNLIEGTYFNKNHKNYRELTGEVRFLKHIHLLEISVVKWPSNQRCFVKCIP